MGRNIQAVRSETIMASINMLRLYLFWRVVRDWMVHDLPKRCTLAGFQRLPIGSTFAVKRMLNSWSVMSSDFLSQLEPVLAYPARVLQSRQSDQRWHTVREQKPASQDMECGRHAVTYLTCIWFALLFLLAYWYRAVEVTVRFKSRYDACSIFLSWAHALWLAS